MSNKKIKFDDIRKSFAKIGYQPIKSIGKGGFGQVILAKQIKTGSQHAIKVINKAKIKKSPYLEKYINQEVQIMKRLNHPNIVKLLQFNQDDNFFFIIMEYCQQGNLLSYQSNLPGRTFQLKHAIQILIDVMKGLKWIHQSTYVHRDIKSENVLLKKQKTKNGYSIRCKIADFGLARPIQKQNEAKTYCGTQRYMAPQIINNSYYGISIDLWSLAVLFYFMLFAQYPFKSTDMRADMKRKCTPYFDLNKIVTKKQKLRDIPIEVHDFFKQIFVLDFKDRITFSKIIKHPLFAPYKNQFEENQTFYKNYEKNQKLVKDSSKQKIEEVFDQIQPEDQTRVYLQANEYLMNNNDNHSRQIERYLQQINFQIQKITYLVQSAQQYFYSYSQISYVQKLLARFYLLKAFIFFSEPFLRCLQSQKIPQAMQQLKINSNTWLECTKTQHYIKMIRKLQQTQLKYQFVYEDTYAVLQNYNKQLPISGLQNQIKFQITQSTFQQFKQNYRLVTAYFFKLFNNKTQMNTHLQNKILFRTFCCHTINRIFDRSQVFRNFPYFYDWILKNKLEYEHSFDMNYFKQWFMQEDQKRLTENLKLLYRTYF